MKKTFKVLAKLFNDPLPVNNIDYFVTWVKYLLYGFIFFSWLRGLWYATLQIFNNDYVSGLYTVLCVGFFFLIIGIAAICVVIIVAVILFEILPDILDSLKDKIRKPMKW